MAEEYPRNLAELEADFGRRRSKSRGKLFFRLVQQAVAVEPVPLDRIIHPGTKAKTKPQPVGATCVKQIPHFGVFSGEKYFEQTSPVVEKPGPWYCPPIAALITAGGRLLLAWHRDRCWR